MTVGALLKQEKIPLFKAVKLSQCRIIKERLISDAPKDVYAVVVAVPYPYLPPKGVSFASFSRIYDYHLFFEAVGKKVKELVLKKYGERYLKVFADHSPIDERHAAASSGLGFMGDNGLFIAEGYGSFVFLGEIIANMTREELEKEEIRVANPSAVGECSHCGRCAAACPAGCIENGDKSICVSALTQKKGVLSDREKAIIKKSGYGWGCDRCAAACPHYTFKNIDYPDFFKKSMEPSWEAVEAMDEEEYKKYAFSWRKKEVIKRNFDIYKEGEQNG